MGEREGKSLRSHQIRLPVMWCSQVAEAHAANKEAQKIKRM